MPSAVVRLLCEARSSSRTVRDAATQERPFYWRGSSVAFQLALTDRGAHLLAAGVGSIIVEVKRLDAFPLDDSLMRKEFVEGDCDAAFTAADWDGGNKALLTATFTVNEAAILPGTYRLIVTHEDPEGNVNIHLSSELAVLDPQTGSEGIDPPPVAWTYLDSVPMVRTDSDQNLSDAQSLQALENLRLRSPTSGLRIVLNSGGGLDLALWNQTTNTYRVLRLEGTPGDNTEGLIFSDPE
ncbi:hypothetical protein OJ996_26015 [Luteolibacter sp. GHJ8]|uniref:Uncharacterized protein n=1 Tax=Luteolibacter rhizosphaerae TaxID=2989719 RepID=A0ABT3GBP5_9BACT|nr:hypothetical protein [Luteolibacter rhizosphaerae]MCW1917072.1 hypothetical protein [Luteolibacter rhizosphaerae]